MNLRITLVASLVSAALASACSSDVSEPGSSDNDDNVPDIGTRLRTFDNSAEFHDALREGLVSQAQDFYGYSLEEETIAIDQPVANGGSSNTQDSDDTAASAPESAGDLAVSDNEVTSTNVQELGVDEQDWVKVNSAGDRLYVLYNSMDDYYISDTVDVELELAEDELVTDSSVYVPPESETTLRIMALDADSPDSSPLRDLTLELQGRHAEGLYLYERDNKSEAFITSSASNHWLYWSEPYAFVNQTSVVTRVDLTDPDSAGITGSITLDGQIVSSRRIGNHLFVASRFYPNIPGPQPYEVTSAEWEQIVNSAQLEDLLPQYSTDNDVSAQALIDPAGCFVSDSASAVDYYSPDIITLSVFNLDTLALSDSECYLGATETLYASPEGVFLATTQYDYSSGPVTTTGEVIDIELGMPVDDVFWSDPRVDTDIHQFDIEEGQLAYAGPGSVQGHLGWNPLRKPFRMSEHDGYLRVATFNDQQGSDNSPILLSVLQADGTGKLVNVATLPNESQPGFIGKPGEQLYASRFLGDRAYLVTFRQTDPLYVIDLADPGSPYIAGELEIEGYSDYLQPIGEDYLLGIGKDAVAATDGIGDGRGAIVQGVKVSLFDVSDPATPTEVQSVLIGQRGTESEALYDHRAITVQTATDAHPARVSFGIDVYGQAMPGSSPSANDAFQYYRWNYSGLHGFDITTGDNAGITSRGVLVVESADSNQFEYYRTNGSDRSVMVNDSLFYIHNNLVFAAPWDDLATPTPGR